MHPERSEDRAAPEPGDFTLWQFRLMGGEVRRALAGADRGRTLLAICQGRQSAGADHLSKLLLNRQIEFARVRVA